MGDWGKTPSLDSGDMGDWGKTPSGGLVAVKQRICTNNSKIHSLYSKLVLITND